MVHALGARGEAAGLSVTVFVSGAAAGAGGATYVSRDGWKVTKFVTQKKYIYGCFFK